MQRNLHSDKGKNHSENRLEEGFCMTKTKKVHANKPKKQKRIKEKKSNVLTHAVNLISSKKTVMNLSMILLS